MDALQAGNNSSHGGSSAYPGGFGAELEKACGDSKAATLIKRPEHSIFGIAMAVGGRVFGQAHLYGMPITFQGIIKCANNRVRFPLGITWPNSCRMIFSTQTLL